MYVRTNVEALVWKPRGLEVLTAEHGFPHTTLSPQGSDLQITFRSTYRMIEYVCR